MRSSRVSARYRQYCGRPPASRCRRAHKFEADVYGRINATGRLLPQSLTPPTPHQPDLRPETDRPRTSAAYLRAGTQVMALSPVGLRKVAQAKPNRLPRGEANGADTPSVGRRTAGGTRPSPPLSRTSAAGSRHLSGYAAPQAHLPTRRHPPSSRSTRHWPGRRPRPPKSRAHSLIPPAENHADELHHSTGLARAVGPGS